MKLLILGAGASWGSSEIPDRPHLTDKLLRILQLNFPKSWGCITKEQAEANGNNFESIMDVFVRGGHDQAAVMNKELGWYFSHFHPDDQSLYVRLMRDVDLSNVVVCTLNYDLLLQRAAALCGKTFYITGFEFYDHGRSVLPRNSKSSSIELLLPHGSAGLVDTGLFQDNMVIGADPMGPGLFPETGRARLCLIERDIHAFYKQHDLNPIMSFIHPRKHTHMGSTNLNVVRERFAAICSNRDGIAVVGMRLNLKDKHILGPLLYSRAPMLTAVGKDGREYKSAFGRRVTDTGQYWREAFDSVSQFLMDK